MKTKKVISLQELLTESETYEPYMYSPVGFGCHVCKFHYKENGIHKCSNTDYIDYMGTEELLDDKGNRIKDPSKWCSNWFKPANAAKTTK